MSAEPADGEAATDAETPADAEPKAPLWRRAIRLAGLLVFLAVVAVFIVYAVPGVIGADHSYIVLTASMSPAIEPGDAIIVGEVEPAEIAEGDAITFYRSAEEPPVTHRVIGITETADGYLYETKGDANDEPDANPVPHENVVGTVVMTLPYLGHAVQFANTTEGFLALVVLPFGLLLLSEVYSIVGASRGDSGAETAGGETEEAEDVMGEDDEVVGAAPGGGDSFVLTPAMLRAAIGVLAVAALASAYMSVQYPAAITVTVAVAASVSLLLAVGIQVVGGDSGGDDTNDPDEPEETDEFDSERAEAGELVGDGAGDDSGEGSG